MGDHHIRIDAVDTLMFRDGRPFNQMDAGASEAASLFPPFPPTVVGAVRALLWAQLGGTWKSHQEKLGDGTDWRKPDRLGPLCFGAPVLRMGEEPVFPVPLHILEGATNDGRKTKRLSRLMPGTTRSCDLGEVRLPIPEDDLLGIKTIEDRWVTASGMTKILNGGLPAAGDLIRRDDLWRMEPRVGVGIDRQTRTTTDGRLYMASHVRLADEVSLSVRLSGWQGGINGSLRPLAGEHRMAKIRRAAETALPVMTTKPEKAGRCLVALSPVVPEPDGTIDGLADDVVSACLGKPIPVGGWDSANKQPIPLRSCIPAGSVWFLSGAADAHYASIGRATEWGFGQMLVGAWQEKNR